MDNTYYNTCPASTDYKIYLQGKGNAEFNYKFEQHTNNCDLCREALAGYKAVNAHNLEKLWAANHNKFSKKLWVTNHPLTFKVALYAASVIILMGLSLSVFVWTNQMESNENNFAFDYSMLIQTEQTNHKVLRKQSNEIYFYISSCDQIAYNDQFLTAEQLSRVLKLNQSGVEYIQIEVNTLNADCANQFINTIRLQTHIPVFTIKN